MNKYECVDVEFMLELGSDQVLEYTPPGIDEGCINTWSLKIGAESRERRPC